MVELPGRTSFAECVGSTFRLHGGTEELTLIEVTRRDQAEPQPSGREPFSVVFRGGAGEHLSQRIYRVEHETLGRLDLFLVPIGPDEHGMRYEAVFT